MSNAANNDKRGRNDISTNADMCSYPKFIAYHNKCACACWNDVLNATLY